MKLLTIDFESFWSDTHTLSKMSPIEYVMHEETELISCSIKLGNTKTFVVFGEDEIRRALADMPWDDAMCIAHNMSMFDSMIVKWRLGFEPKMWGCTLAMARPLHGNTIGVGLGTLVKHYSLGVKNNAALVQTKGKHLKDFTASERREMEIYNRDDTDQCHALFYKLAPQLPRREFSVIDSNIRMLVDARFELDVPMLQEALRREQAKKAKTMRQLAEMLGVNEATEAKAVDSVRDILMSSAKFSALLEARGVPVPMKPSPSDAEKQIPALSKTDDEFMALMEDEDPVVAAAAAARLEAKSTLLETRLQAFLRTGEATNGHLPIPARYYGAHTGRDSGELYNALNLPRINWGKEGKPVPKLTNALRMSLRAPKGKVVIVADKSGIEMRLNHHLWKVGYSTKLWRADPLADIYRTTAAKYYNVEESAVQGGQRQFGKVLQLACLAADTQVLTPNGFKNLIDITTSDRVWDGVEWVFHKGVICRGTKETMEFKGLRATGDHGILTEHGWREWFEVLTNPSLFRSALSSAPSPWSIGSASCGTPDGTTTCQSSSARVGTLAPLRAVISKLAALLGATNARKRLRGGTPKITGGTQTLCLTTRIAAGCLTASPLRYNDATGNVPMSITKPEASLYATSGEKIAALFCAMLSRCRAGTTRFWTWTASTTTEVTSPETYVSSAALKICETGDGLASCPPESPSLKQSLPVYDLVDCGPRNRFAVATHEGLILVHNCGYGTGAKTFLRTAWTMGRLRLSSAEAENGVQGWRRLHPEIADWNSGGWARSHNALQYIESGQEHAIDPWGLMLTSKLGIHGPDGRTLRYPDLRREVNEKTGRTEWKYGHGRHTRYIYGGLVVENTCQFLGRTVLMDDQEQFHADTGLLPALRVYDELVYVVPEAEAEALLAHLLKIMRTPPKWWPELVVWAEGDMAESYGLAK